MLISSADSVSESLSLKSSQSDSFWHSWKTHGQLEWVEGGSYPFVVLSCFVFIKKKKVCTELSSRSDTARGINLAWRRRPGYGGGIAILNYLRSGEAIT